MFRTIVHKLKSTVVDLNGSGSEGTLIRSSSLINQSDIALLGTKSALWVNGTQPVMIYLGLDEDIRTPKNTFPFARLASVTLADQSASFLYHQINGTTLAEEQWDASSNAWLPTVYITVSNS